MASCSLQFYEKKLSKAEKNVATTSGHFVDRSECRANGEGFLCLVPFYETSPIFRSFLFAKSLPVFLAKQTGSQKPRTLFFPPAGTTLCTLRRKVALQMGWFFSPHTKRDGMPLYGAHTAFFLPSRSPAVSMNKSRLKWWGIFNYG